MDSIKSPQLDLDDMASSRTPYNTPPERRRENVYELGEVLVALQSVGRRSSESHLKPPHPNLGDVRDHHVSTSLPLFGGVPTTAPPSSVGSEDSTLSNLSRYLRASSGTPMEKMLTPVEERPAEVEEGHSPLSGDDGEDLEDDPHIVRLTSQKIDGSRSASGMSNPCANSWLDSEVGSSKDSVSILSSWDGERPAGDKFKEGDNILGRCSQQENAKDLSQSSDEECGLERASSLRDKLASKAEETASHQIPESPHRHDVFTDQSPRFLPLYQKRNSLRGEGGSQRSSPLSSTSYATISSQSSYSEIAGDEGSLGDQKLARKFSVSGKYARYEDAYRCTSTVVPVKSPLEDAELGVAGGYSQSSTQESVVTVTDEQNLTDAADVGESCDVGQGEERGTPSGGVSAHLLDRKLSEMKDSLKHSDSGIDETPDASKTFKDGVRRFSMPHPSTEEGGSEPVPFSRALLASRESGLADSPDPETFADEMAMLKVGRPRLPGGAAVLLQVADTGGAAVLLQVADTPQGSYNASETTTPEVEVVVCESLESHAPLDAEDEEDTGIVRKARAEKFSCSYERPRSVPRSLENPSFSRYARTPIRDRDSRFLRSIEFPVSPKLRYRSVSLDKISGASFSPERVVPSSPRAYTMSTSKSAVLTSYQVPVRQPIPVNARNIHPNQRFCVNSDLSPGSPTAAQLNLHSDLYNSPSSSPTLSEKTKKSRRIKDRLKPALRVFKIAPSSILSPSPRLRDPPQETDEYQIPDTPDSSGGSSPLELTSSARRVRMVSPEAVATRMASSDSLRRSQSSEDILDPAVRQRLEREEGAESEATVIGDLVVIPEPKYKSRNKFFDKFKVKKTHKGGSGSPAGVLSKGVYHSMSAGGIALSSSFSVAESTGQKLNKKRHRTPHFV